LSERHKVLVVDDDIQVGVFLKRLLKRKNMQVVLDHSGEQARQMLREQEFKLALLDLKLPDACGLELLREVKALQSSCEVVIMTDYGTIRTAVKAMQLGAYDFLEKPFEDIDELEKLIEDAINISMGQADSAAADRLGELTRQVGLVVGVTQQMRRLISVAHKIAPKDINVLINGETGTGKEVLARFIHAASNRSCKKFLAVNCGAFPDNLLESELFGHEKGAFTGAVNTRRGIFELADGGTLFMDEVGVASLAVQVKMLRVLETGEFMRMGGEKPIKTNVRIIAATNVDLEQAIKEKAFREDLFYRLDVVRLVLPPLRKRREDIPLLAGYFVQKYLAASKRDNLRISAECLRLLQEYNWPGNIRELANTIEQSAALCNDQELMPQHLPDKIRFREMSISLHAQEGAGGQLAAFRITRSDDPVSQLQAYLSEEFPWERLPDEQLLTANRVAHALLQQLRRAMKKRNLADEQLLSLREMECQFISKALEYYGNNYSSAARALGIARSTLYRKVKDYGIS